MQFQEAVSKLELDEVNARMEHQTAVMREGRNLCSRSEPCLTHLIQTTLDIVEIVQNYVVKSKCMTSYRLAAATR